jgi:hypothetical protein
MTDIQEMVQQASMSNVNYIRNPDATEDSLHVVKEFKLYYEKFVGYPVEDGQFYQEAVDLFSSAYRKQPIWSHPLTRTALIGAGSLAATLGIGLALSHDAVNQPVVDQPDSPPAPSQSSYSEQTRTSPVPQITSPTLARVEFSNLQAPPSLALNQLSGAVSAKIKMPLPAPVQSIDPTGAIAQLAARQPQSQLNATSPGQPTALVPLAQNGSQTSTPRVGTLTSSQSINRSASMQNGSRAIAPPQPISAGNTPLRTAPLRTISGTGSENGTPVGTATPTATGETLPSNLTPALPSWVNSNLAPLETNPSEPSEPVQPSSAVEARSNQQPSNQQESNQQAEASVAPNPFNPSQNLGSAQTQTDGIWEVSSSLYLRLIAFGSQGISQPEAALSHPVTTRAAQAVRATQVTSTHLNGRKSIAAKPERPILAR